MVTRRRIEDGFLEMNGTWFTWIRNEGWLLRYKWRRLPEKEEGGLLDDELS